MPKRHQTYLYRRILREYFEAILSVEGYKRDKIMELLFRARIQGALQRLVAERECPKDHILRCFFSPANDNPPTVFLSIPPLNQYHEWEHILLDLDFPECYSDLQQLKYGIREISNRRRKSRH
jgi:hypothetical protein